MLLILAAATLAFRRRDPGTRWFALFAALYGLRLFTDNGTFRFISAIPDTPAAWVTAAITYAIPVVAVIFVAGIYPHWKPVLRWFTRLLAAAGTAELLTDLLRRQPGAMNPLNNVLVLASGLAFLIALFRSSPAAPHTRPVLAGFLVFLLSATAANLSGLGLFSLPFNIEPIGFAIFLGTLGRVLLVRALASQERLADLNKELDIARRIQSSILPAQLPASPHYNIAAFYRPMREIGGDFYDFHTDANGNLAVLIADVSGHGIPAALIASMVKVAFASQHANAGDPARVLQGMNEALSKRIKGHFVTAACLHLDFEARLLRYSAAGHPPILRASSGAVESIQENGLALGFSARSRYRNLEAPIASADRFLLYTDGFTEAHNAAMEEFGLDRLHAHLSNPGAPQDCIDACVQAVSAWSGDARPQEDDLTLVVIHLN